MTDKPNYPITFHVNDLVKFTEDKRPYKVRAVSQDGRYAICTKPFNLRHTYLYTIIDLYNGWRGPDNRVFSRGYETPEEIAANMAELESSDLELSHRRYLSLHIDTINRKPLDPPYDHFTAQWWADRKRFRAEHEARMAARNS